MPGPKHISFESMAKAALMHHDLELRDMVRELMESRPSIASMAEPATSDRTERALAAALAELAAEALDQDAPDWTRSIGAADEQVWLYRTSHEGLRKLLPGLTPEPLRKRNFVARAEYLVTV